MEEKAVELFGILLRTLIRRWTKDSKVDGQNLIDLEQITQKWGLSIWEAKKLNLSIDSFVMEIAQNFMKKVDGEIDSDERKAVIIGQILHDVKCININEQMVIYEFDKPDNLRISIMEICKEERYTWSEKEEAIYSDCVRYISKVCIDFISKLPSFTPEALKVIIQRQNEYLEEIRKIEKELQNMETLIKGIEVTYRDFEKQYRETIIGRYSKVELMGSGISERNVRKYNISSAYVELNCFNKEGDREVVIELAEVFNNENNIWIGGEAGSGKTTFLRWVAICSAKNDYERILNIRGTIPIVIELRRVKNWPLNLQVMVNEFSESFGVSCPNGWLADILKNNRALILIDGLDEIAENRRENTYEFIENLIEKYPKIKTLVTARNSVKNQLNCYSKRYEIIPMKIENIKRFIFYWHRSVLHSDAIVEDGEIRSLQNNLISKITSSSPLKLLARNPLLCAMICALHYVNNQHLPENKMDLYESCCKMLIDARDAERKVQNNTNTYEYIQQLDYSKKKYVLEELAYWMLRNGNALERKPIVVDFLEKLLNHTNIVSTGEKKDGTAECLLDYFIARSGIIREPEEGMIDFIHKTFMEYLAVKSICRNCDWNTMVEQACNINWKETIIMCFSEMGKDQVSQVLTRLVNMGKKKGDDRYVFMASLGASNTLFSDLRIKNEIDRQISKMIPPQKDEIIEIAEAGNYLLPFLSDSEKYSDQDRDACLSLLGYLGTEEIIPDVITYIQGKAGEGIKQYALEIMTEYEVAVHSEYGVKEQLLDILLKSINSKYLATYELLFNMIGEMKIGEKDKKTLKKIRELELLCGVDSDNLYYGNFDFYKYFANIEYLHMKGDICNIDFIKHYYNLKVLILESQFDLSEIVEQLGKMESLSYVERLVIKAGSLNYFCQGDLRNMPNLKYLEISCLDKQLEIDLGSLEYVKNLEIINFEVDCYLASEIEMQKPIWEKRLKNLQVYIK